MLFILIKFMSFKYVDINIALFLISFKNVLIYDFFKKSFKISEVLKRIKKKNEMSVMSEIIIKLLWFK